MRQPKTAGEFALLTLLVVLSIAFVASVREEPEAPLSTPRVRADRDRAEPVSGTREDRTVAAVSKTDRPAAASDGVPGPADARREETESEPASSAPGVQELLGADPESLRAIVLSSRDENLARTAVWAMGNRLRLANEDVEALAARLAATAPEEAALRRAILWALALAPERLPVDTVLVMSAAPSEEVRRTANRTLALAQDSRVPATLLAAARRDPSPVNRAEAITLLALHASAEEAAEFARAGLAVETDAGVRERWTNLIDAFACD